MPRMRTVDPSGARGPTDTERVRRQESRALAAPDRIALYENPDDPLIAQHNEDSTK